MAIVTTNACETHHGGSQGGSHRPPTETEPMPGFESCYLGENAAGTGLPTWQRRNEVVKVTGEGRLCGTILEVTFRVDRRRETPFSPRPRPAGCKHRRRSVSRMVVGRMMTDQGRKGSELLTGRVRVGLCIGDHDVGAEGRVTVVATTIVSLNELGRSLGLRPEREGGGLEAIRRSTGLHAARDREMRHGFQTKAFARRARDGKERRPPTIGLSRSLITDVSKQKDSTARCGCSSWTLQSPLWEDYDGMA